MDNKLPVGMSAMAGTFRDGHAFAGYVHKPSDSNGFLRYSLPRKEQTARLSMKTHRSSSRLIDCFQDAANELAAPKSAASKMRSASAPSLGADVQLQHSWHDAFKTDWMLSAMRTNGTAVASSPGGYKPLWEPLDDPNREKGTSMAKLVAMRGGASVVGRISRPHPSCRKLDPYYMGNDKLHQSRAHLAARFDPRAKPQWIPRTTPPPEF
mmetsp:Transcript_21391/g.52578  ORF Transcript_21391/g.52578 Transcript_21391/m.52578 type:complete len:210 (+) Transcript_21391:3-632(+)